MSVESFAGKINLSLEVKNAGPGLLSYLFLLVDEIEIDCCDPSTAGEKKPV